MVDIVDVEKAIVDSGSMATQVLSTLRQALKGGNQWVSRGRRR